MTHYTARCGECEHVAESLIPALAVSKLADHYEDVHDVDRDEFIEQFARSMETRPARRGS